MRAIRAAGAAATLTAVLVGVPWFLLQVGDPGHLIDVDWRTQLLVAVDSSLVLAVLSLVGWAAWGVVALTVAFELVAALSRQRIRPRLPGAGWLRPAVAALVASLVAAPVVAAADPGPPAEHSAASGAQAGHDAAGPRQRDRSAPGRTYLVRAGDELWTVAERELGSGDRWREVAALNPELTEALTLEPGSVLILPADEGPGDSVVVVDGDSLWLIAERVLGDPVRWPEIHRLNRDLVQDPDVIEVGWRLAVPVGSVEAAPDAGRATDPSPARHEAGPAEDAPSIPPASSHDAIRADDTPGIPPAAGVAAPHAADTAAGSPAKTEGAEVVSGPMADSADQIDSLLGPIGALTAAGVLAGLAARRRLQLAARAVGRRLIPGSAELDRFWSALAGRAESTTDTPRDPTATTVVLGWHPDGGAVTLDLELERTTLLTGPAAEDAAAAAITGLVCAPWAEPARLLLAAGSEWAEALDDPRVTGTASVEAGLTELMRLCSGRRLAMGQRGLADLRADPEIAPEWEPTVVVFTRYLTPAQLDVVADAMALGRVGVSVLALAPETPHIEAAVLTVTEESAGWAATSFTPQLVHRPAKRALLELFQLTGATDTTPAPWWREGGPGNVTPLPLHAATEEAHQMTAPPSTPTHPTLLLLGDVQLTAAAGATPRRALGQCMEYCAWLLEHPGSSPSAMTRALLVAETTRRSNVSRLRSWLGVAPDGANYLPDAYSGRVSLDERVTSDWEQFQVLLNGGVNLAPDSALVEALRLVRGEPLGSFAFQWVWAHQLRADMVSMIVDAACLLADRSLDRGDADLALWAVGRGRLAAPSADELAAREILAHAWAGRWAEADRAALRLTRSARSQGRDLAPELARRIQLALHGAPARRAVPMAD